MKPRKPTAAATPGNGGPVLDLPKRPALPARAGRRPGRPRGRSSTLTRERILDAAERLFAENGYDGTSIRDIASAGKCQMQTVSYHFGQKDRLFDSVVRRRAAVMTDLRVRALDSLRSQAGGCPIDVRRLVRAYVEPFIASAGDGDPGWRNFAALMGRLANSSLGTEVIGRHYDATARSYIEELSRSLPRAPEPAIVEGFMFMVASMLSICADTGRMEQLSASSADKSTEALLDSLVTFLAAGFHALADRSAHL